MRFNVLRRVAVGKIKKKKKKELNKIKAESLAGASRVGHCGPCGEWDGPEEFTAGQPEKKGIKAL